MYRIQSASQITRMKVLSEFRPILVPHRYPLYVGPVCQQSLKSGSMVP